jgi:predicted ABC-class ATPase
MRDGSALKATLNAIDGKGYGSYKQIKGTYDLGHFQVSVDRVQVDPFAPPSLVRVILEPSTADLPEELISDAAGRVAASDFLARRFAEAVSQHDGGDKGSAISIGRPRQQVLERTSVLIAEDRIEARITVGLPAAGRSVRGKQAARTLTEALPGIVEDALLHRNLDAEALREHVSLYRDQESLRSQLADVGLVAFVGEGAILPRRSGDSDAPMDDGAVPFQSPASLRVGFDLPSGRRLEGMGVPEGITVIVGGGYHGKSTLLRALERGVYNHLGGDGRQWVITRSDAASIRAEDGRSVAGVDISPFISGLPSGTDTAQFSTTNASGSTSQAANLVEAVESGSRTLLIDEDTSATNFMIRDDRMRELIAADREPITPFIDRIRPLATERGVSTVLVAGGSGAFFDVADHVIALDAYVPHDVTTRAREIAGGATPVQYDSGDVFGPARPRVPEAATLQARNKTKPAKARGASAIQYGKETVDLAAVSQVVDGAQTEAIAHAMDRVADRLDGTVSLCDAVAELVQTVDREGLDALSPHRGHPGHLARPRIQEIHAAINRYRRLRIRSASPTS